MVAESATPTLEAMRRVAEDTIQEHPRRKRTRPEDKDGQQMYLESLTNFWLS